MASKPAAERPWFTAPLLPVIVILVGVTALLLDGMTPYRTYHRRKTWKTVKGTLASSVQRRRRIRTSARGTSRREYTVRRPQRRVFSKVVTRGWPLKRKKKIWEVRVTYSYPTKTGRMTRVADSPGIEFESEKDAHVYLAKRLDRGTIKVWMNPTNPSEATAFMDYPSVLSLVIGFVLIGLGVLWLFVALLLRRAHVRQEAV